jgi:excisionase family DNA binding protein
MPARLKQPGNEQGACIGNCTHLDCLSVKQIASERCRRNYYAESQAYIHEDCLKDELVKKTSAKEERVVFLTTDEVADLFRSTPATITQWVSQGKIPFRKANGKTLFLLDEVLNWTMPTRTKKGSQEPRLRVAK